jgi:septum formation protein
MLKQKLKNIKIILASGSPRRQQFFKDLDLDFEIRLKDVAEIYPDHLKREEITNFLAKLKADAQKNELLENELLITSDTIVWLNNKALGKPVDESDAVLILKQLSGQTHEVITSVCFMSAKKCELIFDVTRVTFAEFFDDEIEYYLKNYKPFDKAGAYGIQEWIGFVGVTSIEGSYTNVMGLPTHKVYDYLKNLEC